MWDPIAELSEVHTLVSAAAGHLAGATGAHHAVLLIATVHAVCLPITTPGLGHTLTHTYTAKLIGPADWGEERIGESRGEVNRGE